MQKRILSIAFIAFLFSIIFIGCSKLDTTDIGSDLLPAVDNVNTFDTLLTIEATQGIFNPDTTKLNGLEDHVLGTINNDPLFGTTTADIYAEFKPTFYPYYYGNVSARDTLVGGIDSVVLGLSYKGFWGDSINTPLQLQVKEIPSSTGGLWDSLGINKELNYAPVNRNSGVVIGSSTINIASLGNYVKIGNGKDSVKNQVRIKLSQSFVNGFNSIDTNATNPYKSDSLFRVFKKGFAIIANGTGNGLLYTNLTDSSSRLEIHYKRKIGAVIDTTYSLFKLSNFSNATAAIRPSSTANNIIRNRSGFPVSNPPASEIYLQTTPGTYANLKIPSLGTLSNRIIHRAEIIIEQVPFNTQTDGYFSAPDYLYLDLKDSSTSPTFPEKWKPLYFDLNPNTAYDPDSKVNTYFPGGGIDFLYYGGYARNKKDVFGNPIKYYNFNITRYVQQIVTKHTNNYTLRLQAPYNLIYPQYLPNYIPYNNRLAYGRVKVGSGTNLNYKMRLRIVYSKI
ncbi:DUF4270 family protein [Ferruginibacter sp.]